MALTGYGDSKTAGRVTEAGFDVYLVKPVDAGCLLAVVAGGD